MDHVLPLADRIAPLRSSVFAILVKRMAGYTGKRYPFHIGDNALRPPVTAEYERSDPSRFGDPYRYGHPAGEQVLRAALAERAASVHGHSGAQADNIQVTIGATHAISCALSALLDPGDEVLLLSPYWPLVRGISYCVGVKPVDVPFYQEMLDAPEQSQVAPVSAIEALIEPYITDRTRYYVISPNNPNGLVLSREQSEAIASVARNTTYGLSMTARMKAMCMERASRSRHFPGCQSGPSRPTHSVKLAMAGTRIGYAVASERVIGAMRRVATHSVYNPAQVCQSSAWAALEGAEQFLTPAVESYKKRTRMVSEVLTATPFYAQGGSFVSSTFERLGRMRCRCLSVRPTGALL